MAESILKLKVDDKEYNSSLRNARQGMVALEQSLQQAGKSFSDVDSKVVEYVRAIGNMNTQSTTAKGKIGEMGTAFTELSMQYKRMTEQEKASPVGKALSESLDQLKGRIQQTKKDLDDVTRSLNTTDVAVKQNSSDSAEYGNVLQGLAGQLGVNTKFLTAFGAVIGTTTAAIKVASDAFNMNESNIDEWGRTVEGAKGAYESFLASLNSDSWGNFFTNIETAINGARDLYDAMDRLNSVKGNNAAAIAYWRNEVQRLRVQKQNGGNVDLLLKAAEGNLKSLQSQVVQSGKSAGRQMINKTITTAYNQQTGAGAGLSEAKQKEIADKILMYGQSYFDEQKAIRDRLAQKADASYSTIFGEQHYPNVNKLSDAEREQYLVANAVTEAETRLVKGINQYAQALGEESAANKEEFRTNRYVLQGGGRGAAGGGKKGGAAASWSAVEMKEVGMVDLGRSVNDINADLAKAQRAYNEAGDAIGRAAAKAMVEKLQGELTGVKNEGDVTKGGFADAYNYDFSKVLKEFDVNTDGLDEANKKTKKLEEAANNAANAARSIGQAFSSIEDPAANIMGMIAEAIATVALTFSKSLKGTVDPWEWIAAAAAGTATMISTIAAIQSNAGNFANGGIVPGNSFTGDNMIAHVNSGELILDKAKQDSIANLLTQNENGVGGYMGVPYVNGENIILGVNNTFSRKGKGEVVTTGMLKKMGVI